MGQVIVTEHVTLDGVMQAPARDDEDRRGGFDRGGWAVGRAQDEVTARVMGQAMARPGALVLGRRTYEDLARIWPARSGNPYTDALNKSQKYVASRTLRDPVPWQNSSVLAGDAAEAVAALKASMDGVLSIIGSGELVSTLARHDLIDEYVLLIHPIVLGQGRRLFGDGAPAAEFRLVDCVPTTTGVIIATYRLGAG
jgi:dihydrofolate reductase